MTANEILAKSRATSSYIGTPGAIVAGVAIGTVAQRLVDGTLDSLIDWAKAKMIEKGLY